MEMKRYYALLALAGLQASSTASAHDARPLSVNIDTQADHAYLVRLRVPPTVEFDNWPQLNWPQGCRPLNQRHPEGRYGESETLMLKCGASLEGRALTVRYPIYNPSLPTLFRLKRQDGTVLTQLLGPDQMVWQVPARQSWSQVARSYLALGVEHIWTGIDHLLFVTGLLILAGSTRRVLLAITGFTIAHSITLSLSALDVVRLPVPPVEAAIALSILFLAREIARPMPDGLSRRFPITVSSSFGLLHGFGFAAALREVGLPTDELATGLLCFNLGVEIGQIAFIVAVIALFVALQALLPRSGISYAVLKGHGAELAGYGLGLPAAYWFIERMGALL
jgi:hydrogenase/urease accessory protein HupE